MISLIFRSRILIIVFLISGTVSSQSHFTLPKNVWRLTLGRGNSNADWISWGGKKGLYNERFSLEGYGQRYYDHSNRDSENDLVALGDITMSGGDKVKDIISAFNYSSAAAEWGKSLFDFGEDFFGSDSIFIGGYITNPNRTLKESLVNIGIEYGLTDKVTFFINIPYYTTAQQQNRWGWKSGLSQDVDLEGFIAYHDTNKVRFEELFLSNAYSSVSFSLRQLLESVYENFYTQGGKYSLLWALKAGSDPYGNAIYGAEYNPFSDSDTAVTTVDSLIAFYHPDRSTSGLGDVRWGFNALLFGSPVWAGESIYSVYGGIGMILPMARILQQYDATKVDTTGRPKQFKQLMLGNGVTQWRFSLFGEFYRSIFDRMVRFNWRADYLFSQEGKFWPRMTPRGLFTVQHDSVLKQIGEVYRMKRGDVLSAQIAGFIELIPDRFSVSLAQEWYLKRRDTYYSDSAHWNEWMAGGTELHDKYDTRFFLVSQRFGLVLHNIHPLRTIGPVPFELEISTVFPVITRHSWRRFIFMLSFNTYFQFW